MRNRVLLVGLVALALFSRAVYAVNPQQADVTDNHIPVDSVGQLIHLDKRADVARASVGDIITYTLVLSNGSPRNLTGVDIRDILPAGLAFVRGNARIAIHNPDQSSVAPRPLDVAAHTPLDFGPFEVHAGGTATIVYQAVVGLDTREGIYENVADAYLQNVPLPGVEARARVRVVNDPIFDQGLLFGRVFCDRDGDGKPGPDEEGVFGARVYLDNGWYAVTDETGKYHLKDISPGVHLAKIDAATVTATISGDDSQIIWFTRGLPAKANFAVRCTDVDLVPDQVKPKAAQGPAPPKMRKFHITGDLNAWTLQIDGMGVPMPHVKISGPATLAAPGPISFQVESSRADAWTLRVGKAELSGRGTPPEQIDWDGKGLEAGKAYTYQIEIARLGAQASSAIGAFSVGGEPQVAIERRIQGFTASGIFTAAGKRALQTLAADIPRGVDVQIDAHTETRGGAVRAMATTAIMARAAKDLLVASGLAPERIHTRALGASKPILPGISPRARAQNRRLEIRITRAATPAPPATPPTGIAEARVAGKVMPHRFATDVELLPEGRAVIEMQRADGSRVLIPIGKPTATTRAPMTSDVEGDLGRQRATVFGRSLLLDLLRVDLTAPSEVTPGTPVRFTLSQPLVKPARWMLVVRRDDGEPAWRESGQGAPPPELMWAADNAVAGRTYYAQLLVDDGSGGRGSSPERMMRIAVAKPAESQVSGRLFTGAGAPTLKLLAFVAQFKGHTVQAVVRLPRNLLVATARAATVRKALLAAGATQAEVRGTVGPGQPMVRVSVETHAPPPAQPVARVVVGGRDAPVDASGHFQLHASETPGAPVVLDVTDAEGRRAVYIVQPPVPTAPAKKVLTTEEGTVVTGAQPVAARLRVHLPPRGITLGAPELAVRGSTDPKNKLTINGREVVVRSDGTFAELVPLAYGASVVEIRSVDRDGNTAIIRYPALVKDTHFFLLALGDVAYSQAWDSSGKLDPEGARLDGMTDETSLQTDSFLLHGRAALYLKARIHGGALAKYLDITAHADSAKRSEFEDFIAQVVDPARFYPVYGDAALEIQDVRARDKLYLSIETDDKKDRLLVGNFRSQTKGLELFNYDRALYGGEIDVEKQIEHTNTKVKAFVSQDDGRLAKDHDVFRSTGGSIYFLRHQQLVPGGEHAQIVVRDRDSGMPLLTQPLARDSDYVIDYNGGRLFLKAPIPSVADASFLAGNFTQTTSTLQGHPVYIEIDYDYQTDGVTTGTVWGAQVHETFAGHITIGGGYVSEGREGADYKLWGVDSTLQLGKKSTFRAEFARSQSTDAGNFLSNDGGLSFYGLNGICPSLRACNPNADHDAFKFELTIVPADWMHLGDDDLRGRGYIQVLDRGFYSSGSILEQGRTKYGGEIQWKLTPNDRILLRHDGSIAELPQLSQALGADPSGTAKLETELTTLQYAGGRGRWSWKGEYDHQFMQNSGPFTDASQRLGPEINRDSVAAAGAYKLTSRWTLRAGQEVVLHTSNDARAPDPQIGSFDDHRFATTTLGVDYKLPSLGDTTASATGALRWNGDASLLFGLKTHISPTASVYANERLESVEMGSNWTSIVGAEDRFGDQKTGRTYGEYQLQSGASGQLNRALLGLTNRWEPVRGISFNGGYEHQHSFGASLPDGTPLGDQQRDVLSLGYQILRSERFKLGGRFELRFDDIGGNLSGTPCLGNAQADPRYSPCSNTLQPTPTSGPQSGLFADRTPLPGSQLMLSPGKKLEWFTTHTGEWQWHQDLTFLGRFTLLQVDDQTYNRLEARLIELTGGLAYRPLRLDWFNLIFKYTKLLELRPTGVSSGLHTDRHSDVVTLIPIFELPLRLQLVEKVAFKHIDQTDDVAFDPLDPSLFGQLHARTDLVLWINRVNAHVTQKLDAGIEYRVLKLWLPGDAEQTRHGMLVEVNYAVQRFVRLGVGFNFSRFGDNELLDPTVDAFGFFVRVVGRY